MTATMTADRFRECLAMLHWSQRGLAEILYCDDRLVRRWAQGNEPVPESIARWIEKLAFTHEALPPPTSRR
jgi:transcriptional regulator with XRE-family HTH domain